MISVDLMTVNNLNYQFLGQTKCLSRAMSTTTGPIEDHFLI
jgi:hypothetical protein